MTADRLRADHLILGGGSAGCVLAARLTEDPRREVILVEAGRDISAGDVPDDIRSRYPGRAYLDTSNIWQSLKVLMGDAAQRAPQRYEQAKLLGGGSAINALMANRGAPADYDEWEALGAAGWNWEACLPFFRGIEADRDYDGPLHGKDGPLSIRRVGDDGLSPFVAKVLKTLDGRGYPQRADQNGPWQDGGFRGAVAVSDAGERLPTSIVYLTPEVRKRPNLRVLTGHQAARILFEGWQAVGADVIGPDGRHRAIDAGEVIVSAGAIHTPALLLRSGVGQPDALREIGIAAVAPLAGVGRNLMEHPSIAVAAYLPPSLRVRNPGEHHEQGVWRYSSGLPGTPQGDMHGAILSRSAWHSVGLRIGSIFFWVNKSYSRGFLKLTDRDPRAEPFVDFRLLSDARDLQRLKEALRKGIDILTDPRIAGDLGPVFPASYSPRVAKVALPGRWNAFQRGLLSAMLDVAGPLRATLIHTLVTLGVTKDRLVRDDDALTDFVRRNAGGTWHASGTCRMGGEGDPAAVTSPTGKVHGVGNLRVADASLMPSIPCANTNIPTIMIAERIADFIRRGL